MCTSACIVIVCGYVCLCVRVLVHVKSKVSAAIKISWELKAYKWPDDWLLTGSPVLLAGSAFML